MLSLALAFTHNDRRTGHLFVEVTVDVGLDDQYATAQDFTLGGTTDALVVVFNWSARRVFTAFALS